MIQPLKHQPLLKPTLKILFTGTVWYLVILLIIHVTFLSFSAQYEQPIGSFLSFSFNSMNIFLVAIGISIPYYSLPNIKFGYTRKQIFLTIIKSSLLLISTLLVIVVVITFVQHLIIGNLVNPTMYNAVIQNSSGSIHLDLSSMNTPLYQFLDFSNSWSSTILVFLVSTLFHYTVGLIIGIGYYRYGWIIGFLFVALALIALVLHHFIWNFSFFHTSILPATIILLLSTGIIFTTWQFIKNVTVKL